MKLVLIVTFCFGLLGCEDPRSLSKAEIEKFLVENAQFEEVEISMFRKTNTPALVPSQTGDLRSKSSNSCGLR